MPRPVLHAMIRNLNQLKHKASRSRRVTWIERRKSEIIKELRRRRNLDR
jgi:hypothetical protein